MDKKALKDFINNNGFFIKINELEKVSNNEFEGNAKNGILKNSIKTNAKIPENGDIQIFKGLSSQQFGVGESSRNGYRIDVAGWDFSNYIKNPIILLRHEEEFPIGRCLEILPNENGIDIVYFVDYSTMDEKTAYKVKNGYYGAISTGHRTIEACFEDGDGNEYADYREAEKAGVHYTNLNFVVKKAESIENSVVTIGSNPDALVTYNSLSLHLKEMQKKANGIGTEEAEEIKTKDPEENKQTTDESEEIKKAVATDENSEATKKTDENSVEEEEPKTDENSEEEEEAEEAKPEDNDKVLMDTIMELAKAVKTLSEDFEKLKSNSISKKVVVNSQFTEPEAKKTGTSIKNFLESQGFSL